MRQPEALNDLLALYSADKLLVIKLDVTERDEVSSAFAKAREVFGRVDIVLGNAGYGLLAEVEGTSEEEARGIFEVNFWGAVNVTKEAVAFFREYNHPIGGRLINVSSLLGVVASPLAGFYTATKFGKPPKHRPFNHL